MRRLSEQIYRLGPPGLRNLAATFVGYYFRRWRYGSETDLLVASAIERESWASAQWQNWHKQQVAQLLSRAATRVPYYRAYWEERRRQGDTRSWETLSNWPILTKEDLRRNPAAFLADDCNPRRMFQSQTSGSTGTPLRLWQSQATIRSWYALFEARWRQWYGVSRHDRWAILGGQLVAPVAQRTPPFWVHNRALNQLYLSTYHLAPDLIPHYVKAIREFNPKYLWGYSSSLHALAQEYLRQGHSGLQFRVVVTNAEPLYSYQRETIQEAFQCPVRETYGMSEMVAGASECEHGKLHLWPDAGLLEVDEPDETGTGDFLATGFVNRDMPLIRYRVGDRGSLDIASPACKCGRTLPLLGKVEGKSADNITTSDGRRIFSIGPIFHGLDVREAQIEQNSLDLLTFRYAPTRTTPPSLMKVVEERVRERLGPFKIVFAAVDQIPRGPNGKFRLLVSMLSRDQVRAESD
jgi:phenylacetate-CoA ligase